MDSVRITRGGDSFTLAPAAPVRADNTLMVRQMVLAGCGIGYLPEWLLRADLQTGRLRRLLPDYRTAPVPFYAVYTQRKLLSAKVRSFIDFMVEKATNEQADL